jgi:hypothetical protein
VFYYLNHPITAVETFNYVYGQGWLTPVGGSTQIQGDWDQTNNAYLDFIKNKPSIPAAQIQSDWNQTNNAYSDFIKNKPSIPSYSVFDSYYAGLVPASGVYGYDYFVNGLGNWQYNLEYRAGYRTRMTFDLTYANTYDVDNIDYHNTIDSVSSSIPYTSSFTKFLVEDTLTGRLYRRTMSTAGGVSTDSVPWVYNAIRHSVYPRAYSTARVSIGDNATTANINRKLHVAGSMYVLDTIHFGGGGSWLTSKMEGLQTNYAMYAGWFGGYPVGSIFKVQDSAWFQNYIRLDPISAPSPTTNKLYNVGGSLYWHGSAIGGGIGGSGGTGQVPFFSASTTLAGDANLFWDNTHKYLGIGTSSPSSSIHSLQTTEGTNDLTIESTNTGVSAVGFSLIAHGTNNNLGLFQLNDNAVWAGDRYGQCASVFEAQGTGGLQFTANNTASTASIRFNTLVGSTFYNRLKINNDGTLIAPATYSATVGATNAALFIDNTGLIGKLTSSRRYKENIKPLGNVNWLYDLDTKTFNYKTDSTKSVQTGLIAEQVDSTLSPLGINKIYVGYDKDGRPESVNYDKLVTPMLKAIQDQQKEIQELKARIRVLEKKE